MNAVSSVQLRLFMSQFCKHNPNFELTKEENNICGVKKSRKPKMSDITGCQNGSQRDNAWTAAVLPLVREHSGEVRVSD